MFCSNAGLFCAGDKCFACQASRSFLELLLARDFGAFEDALATLAERGFVLRGGG